MRINNIVVVADVHAGCRMAICPPGPIALDDGGDYMPSPNQRKLYKWWREFWDEYVPEVTQGEPYVIVSNGDTTDGVHHNTVTQISQNLVDQRRIARALLAPEIEKAAAFYAIRGTEAHVGPSAQHEETLAEELGAVPEGKKKGQWFARYELWIRCGPALCHIMHHIGTTSRMAYETSALMAELTESYADAGRWRRPPPDAVVRSHRHRQIEVRVPTQTGNGLCFTTAAWQLKTPLVYRIAGGRNSTPMVGASVIRYHVGELYARHFTRVIQRPKEVKADG